MQKSFPFNAVIVDGVPDRVYAAEDFAAERAAYVSDGVTAPEALTVTAAADGAMAVEIAPGAAVIRGYTYWNTEPLLLPLSAADTAQARLDLVVLRLDLTARTMYCAVLTGAAGGDPVLPRCADTDSLCELPLYSVSVPAGAAVPGEITDLRPRADYILNPVEVEAALAEYKAALSSYFDGEDADRLSDAAKIVRKDAGADAVLCGDGIYRRIGTETELLCITEDGAFRPAEYPTADGCYTVAIQAAGGGGAAADGAYPGGGAAGGYLTVRLVPPLRESYSIMLGRGGAPIPVTSGCSITGKDGGDTIFGRYVVPGGAGGVIGSGSRTSVTNAGLYQGEPGTTGGGGRGGSSEMGAGGANAVGTAQNAESAGYGAGGGGCGTVGYSSGRGGSGCIRIYGVAK